MYSRTRRNNKKQYKRNKSRKIGGSGYYLALDKNPPGGLSTVKSYDSCCPPVFKSHLTSNKVNTTWKPCMNNYNVSGGRRKLKKNRKSRKNRKY